MHLNGTDLAEQDFDIVCKKFLTACLTQCPAPEVIYLLQAFSILWPCLRFLQGHLSCRLAKRKKNSCSIKLEKLSWMNPTAVVFCLYAQRFEHESAAPSEYFIYSKRVDQQEYCEEVEPCVNLLLGACRITRAKIAPKRGETEANIFLNIENNQTSQS